MFAYRALTVQVDSVIKILLNRDCKEMKINLVWTSCRYVGNDHILQWFCFETTFGKQIDHAWVLEWRAHIHILEGDSFIMLESGYLPNLSIKSLMLSFSEADIISPLASTNLHGVKTLFLQGSLYLSLQRDVQTFQRETFVPSGMRNNYPLI